MPQNKFEDTSYLFTHRVRTNSKHLPNTGQHLPKKKENLGYVICICKLTICVMGNKFGIQAVFKKGRNPSPCYSFNAL